VRLGWVPKPLMVMAPAGETVTGATVPDTH
jgi:hypothetical protein